MNWDEIKGDWTNAKGKVKEQWGELTDDDLMQARGGKDQLIGRIQSRYGKTREEASQEVDEFLSSSSGWLGKVQDTVTEKAHEVEEYFKKSDMSDIMDDVQKVIAKYPTQAVILSLGVGFLIGRGLGGGGGR